MKLHSSIVHAGVAVCSLMLVIAWQSDDLSAEEPMREIFDGRSLSGWEPRPAKGNEDHWKVDQGVLIAENKNKKGSVLWTEKEFKDYELELDYQTSSDYYDTGVMLRGDGHQVQIGISGSLKKDMTACIYAPKDKRGSYPAQSDKIESVHKVGQWNHLRILVTGQRIQTFLNGQEFVDYTGLVMNEEGPIGLQLHAGHHMKIQFKNIRMRERNSE